ncbi:MAG: Cyclic nucleotide-binding protein, partial [Caldanaerobacter subterraneus]
MMVLVLFLSGCDNLKTPGEAIKPPKNIANAALQDGNVPLWTIQSNGERFFDTTFISEDEIVTLVYKDGNIYLRSYDKDKMIEEKLLGTKADYRILNTSLNKFVVKKGETEIVL